MSDQSATHIIDQKIRELAETLRDGTASDAIGRHVCAIALGEPGNLGRPPTDSEIARARVMAVAAIDNSRKAT